MKIVGERFADAGIDYGYRANIATVLAVNLRIGGWEQTFLTTKTQRHKDTKMKKSSLCLCG